MDKRKEVLRLKSEGRTRREIARILGIDRGTVSRYYDGEDPLDEDITDIPIWVKKLDWPAVNEQLNDGIHKKILFEENREIAGLPSYQAFCQYLRNHDLATEPEVTIRQQRVPGLSMEVDYSGDSISIICPSTGEVRGTELFVCALSYSGYFYAEFVWSQKIEDFIKGHTHSLIYFGCSPGYTVPDNCKAAVTKASKIDPIINQSYKDFCRYYGLAVDPADPYSPRHKPNVEKAVGYLQSSFFQKYRHHTFTSLAELNNVLREWLSEANNKIIQGRGKSRKELFEFEKISMRALPEKPYELFYFKQAKVHPDCHVQHDKNYYSVPFRYVGKTIDVKFNSSAIHLYFNCDLIATHTTYQGTYHWSTNMAHYPEGKLVESNYFLGQSKSLAQEVGPNFLRLILRLMATDCHPLKSLRKIQNVLSLRTNYSSEALEHAADKALEFEKTNYFSVKLFAKNYQRPKEKVLEKPPLRDQLFICLQGGKND